ncbi:hypothetical protein CEXT_523881 [Caerostris extrusa]|uniref:Uncharacterized protein n=1 Tax=Caerostris extrusa TaxID=172846 RepID=A0AAV4XLH2_CAEEX|nr:hypothetical protein CEXT_523881 [Caerostris extrusa]
MHSPHHTNSRRFRKVFEGRHHPTPQKLLRLCCYKNLHFSMNTDEKPIRNNNNKTQPEERFVPPAAACISYVFHSLINLHRLVQSGVRSGVHRLNLAPFFL